MQDRPEERVFDNPLRHLTAAQFMALGGNAVVYVRAISGEKLAEFMSDIDEEDAGQEFHMVVSADGSPLLVADSREAVAEWLSDKNLGIVALH
jgi:hypothetical protein